MEDIVCERTGKPCRHCSEEKFTNISRVGVIATGQIEIRKTVAPLGQRCNNDGRHLVRELSTCPIPGALSVPLIRHEVSELEWSRRKGGV